ncbi:MAG: ChaN family lipoprotein [Nitrospirota bacterium]
MTHCIFDADENITVDFEVFLNAVKNRDVIYIGEFHQVPEILSFQADVISGLLKNGFQPSIGLEMFNVLQQKIIDYYMASVIPFEQLMSLYEMGPEGFDLEHYVKIVDIAQMNRLKVIGLSIPRSIASAVAKHGLDSKELGSFNLNEQGIKNCSIGYRKALGGIFQRHPHGEITEENFILAQSVKDEMMAETIVHCLTVEHMKLPLIVIAGRGHIEYGLGIPERVREKMNRIGGSISDVLVVAVYDDEQFENKIADYLLKLV